MGLGAGRIRGALRSIGMGEWILYLWGRFWVGGGLGVGLCIHHATHHLQNPTDECSPPNSGGRVALAIARCRKPVIGALNGSAVGIGITMTLPMNIRLAPASAKIGFVFARRGLVMEAVSSFYLPRLIGYSRAMQVVTTGATYRASDPVWGGLFAEVLEKGEDVLPRALEMAEEVVKNTSMVSTYLMKEMMWRGRESPEATHLLDSRILYEMFQSA